MLAEKFATDREESVPDGICFAVPVFNAAGEVNLALSSSLPKMRLRDQDHEKAIVAALRVTTRKLCDDVFAHERMNFADDMRFQTHRQLDRPEIARLRLLIHLVDVEPAHRRDFLCDIELNPRRGLQLWRVPVELQK